MQSQSPLLVLDIQYLAPGEFQKNFKLFPKLANLHLNIRSITKNFEALKQFYLSLNFNFSILWGFFLYHFSIFISWSNDMKINKSSSFQLPDYNTEHQIRKSGRGGGAVCIFIHESLDYKVRKNL